MRWVRVDTGAIGHRKMLALAATLWPDGGAWRTAQAVGAVVSLWAYLVHYDRAVLDAADTVALARWLGVSTADVSSLLGAMERVGLVEATADGLMPKDWLEYHGKFVDWQRREAERKARARAKAAPGPTRAARSAVAPLPPDEEPASRRQMVLASPPAVAQRSVAAIRERIGDTFAMAQAERTAAQRRAAMAEIVFAYWAAKMGRDATTLLDQKRESRLVARLKENRDNLSELLYCVDGAARDDFLMGRSPRSEGRTYNGIEQVFRDRGQVERLSVAGGYRDGATHPLVTRHGAQQGESV